MYFARSHGMLTPSLWGGIERTMSDLIAYPGIRQWWETRKHWRTHEFAGVVDGIIAKGTEPRTYATYNLTEMIAPAEGESGAISPPN